MKISFISLSQKKIAEIIYINGVVILNQNDSSYTASVSDVLYEGMAIHSKGDVLLMDTLGGLVWFDKGHFVTSDIKNELISEELLSKSLQIKNDLIAISNYNIDSVSKCCKDLVNKENVLVCNKKAFPLQAIFSNTCVAEGVQPIGNFYKPKIHVRVSSEAKNPKFEIYNLFGEVLHYESIKAGFQGEIDIANTFKPSVGGFVGVRVYDDIDDFKDNQTLLKYCYLPNSKYKELDTLPLFVFEDMSLNPFDEIIYAMYLRNEECYLESVSAILRGKKSMNDTQKRYANVFLSKWVYCNQKGSVLREPIIYMYGEKDLVTIDVSVNGSMDFSYPEYSKGWKFSVTKEGLMTSKVDSSKHKYLFWEGEIQSQRLAKRFQEGFCVNSDTLVTFLRNKLTEVGLNELEINDFIVFWVPHLKKNELNFIRFDVDDECNEFAAMKISPNPESIKRVYMLYKPLTKVIDFIPQTFQRFDRNGFVVVEWGGIELNKEEFVRKK